jgi:hypothetical protein
MIEAVLFDMVQFVAFAMTVTILPIIVEYDELAMVVTSELF